MYGDPKPFETKGEIKVSGTKTENKTPEPATKSAPAGNNSKSSNSSPKNVSQGHKK